MATTSIKKAQLFSPRFKVGSITRDQTLATSLAITGLGFKPAYIMFFMAPPGGSVAIYSSWGMDDGVTPVCITTRSASTSFDAYSIFAGDGATWAMEGKISSFDADGFTIAWTKTGTPPAGNITIRWTAFY